MAKTEAVSNSSIEEVALLHAAVGRLRSFGAASSTSLQALRGVPRTLAGIMLMLKTVLSLTILGLATAACHEKQSKPVPDEGKFVLLWNPTTSVETQTALQRFGVFQQLVATQNEEFALPQDIVIGKMTAKAYCPTSAKPGARRPCNGTRRQVANSPSPTQTRCEANESRLAA